MARKRGRFAGGTADIAGAVACVILSLAAYALVVVPARSLRTAGAEFDASLRSSRAKLVQLEHERDALAVEVNRVAAALASSRIDLRPLRALNARLAALVDAASRAGIEIQETRADEATPRGRFRAVPVHLAGTGTYPQVAHFLHVLHMEMPDVEVVTFELSGKSDADEGRATLVIDLVWYAVSGDVETS
jgi:hypothetical protein